MQADLAAVESRLAAPKPNQDALRVGLRSVRTILEGAAGNLIASGIYIRSVSYFRICKLCHIEKRCTAVVGIARCADTRMEPVHALLDTEATTWMVRKRGRISNEKSVWVRRSDGRASSGSNSAHA